jgi:hypothetical protein
MVSYIWLIAISDGHETKRPGTLTWDLYTGLEMFLWARDESYKTMKLSFVSFSVLCLSAVSFLGASFPGQAAPNGRSGSCFRRRSGSSSRRMLLSHAFCPCLSPVASSPRSRALSSSASPVLLGFLVSSVALVNNFNFCFQQ